MKIKSAIAAVFGLTLLASAAAHAEATASAALSNFQFSVTALDPADVVTTPSASLSLTSGSANTYFFDTLGDARYSSFKDGQPPVVDAALDAGNHASGSAESKQTLAGTQISALTTAGADRHTGGGRADFRGTITLAPGTQVTLSADANVSFLAAAADSGSAKASLMTYSEAVPGLNRTASLSASSDLQGPGHSFSDRLSLTFGNGLSADPVTVSFDIFAETQAATAHLSSCSPVPEPAGACLMLAGLGVLGLAARRRAARRA